MGFNKFCFFTLSLLFFGANCHIKERLKQDFFNIYKHTAIEAKELLNEHVTPDKITYYLYTKQNPRNYTELDPSEPDELVNKNVTIVFIIHGWSSSREADWFEDLTHAFLLREEEFYVVQVDWSDPATQFYTISSWNTKDVGNIIGEFVADLHKNYSIPISNFLFVGHSLGAHVCGYAGKKVQELTKEKLPRIVGLDPAGPFFSTRPSHERLNKTDADVVHIIHTDGGTFGFKPPFGTMDFFPNGGTFQPGCAKIDLFDVKSVGDPVICSHIRSPQYFIEAVLNPTAFVSKRCSSWIKFRAGLCTEEVSVAMGDLKSNIEGNFYLETNKDKPFAKKESGFGLDKIISTISLIPH